MKKTSFLGLSALIASAILLFGYWIPNVRSANSQKACIGQQYSGDRSCIPSLSKKLVADGSVNDSKPKIQIAILLDSSNSMDGLIEQARTQIWDIVNALTKVTKNGQTPILEVSLFHYGNDSLPSTEGFNRLLSNMTTDLDVVSEKLFSIQTNGGQEYAGWVMESALNQLNWSDNSENFQVIFIAGNEPFNQGDVSWQKSINLAKNKNIIVNTIYCEDAENEDGRLWAEAAKEGQGGYFNINQNQKVDTIPTPYDKEIFELNSQLNQTYLPYGSEGAAGQSRQEVQDSNLANPVNPQAAISRAVSKTSAYYRNSSWDLVDAVTEGTVNLESLDKAQLPQQLQDLSLEEKESYIQKMDEERRDIQAKIAQLSTKRNEYIKTHSVKNYPQNTLNQVMIEALRQQLKLKGFILQ